MSRHEEQKLLNVPLTQSAPKAAAGGGGDGEKRALSDEERQSQRVRVASAVLFYMSVSIGLVFANKYVLSSDSIDLDAPLFLTWTQLVIAVLICYAVSASKPYTGALFDFFPPFEYKPHVALKVMPLTFVFLGMVVANNYCLKYVEVSFYQVARSLTIVFNIALTYAIMGKTTSALAIVGCAVVICGFVVGSVAELRFTMVGSVFGVLSSLFVALYAIFVKRILPVVDDNTWLLMIYNNLNASLVMPLLFAYNEGAAIAGYEQMRSHSFWGVVAVTGLLGFLINIASFTQIKVTSALTHNVSGTVKTVLAVLIYNNPTTEMFWGGFFLTILGSAIYTYARFQ